MARSGRSHHRDTRDRPGRRPGRPHRRPPRPRRRSDRAHARRPGRRGCPAPADQGPAGVAVFAVLFGLGYGVLSVARPDPARELRPRHLYARLSGIQALLVIAGEAAGPTTPPPPPPPPCTPRPAATPPYSSPSRPAPPAQPCCSPPPNTPGPARSAHTGRRDGITADAISNLDPPTAARREGCPGSRRHDALDQREPAYRNRSLGAHPSRPQAERHENVTASAPSPR